MFSWFRGATKSPNKPPNKPRNNKSKSFFQNPFASYPPVVQQPVAVPVPVPVPASQLDVNSVYANNRSANLLKAAYPNNRQANLLRAAYPNNRQANLLSAAYPNNQQANLLRAAYPNQPAKTKSVNVDKFNELHSTYYDLESDRFDYKKKYNGKKRFNKVPPAENEAAVKKATDAVEQFLKSLPPESINYISEDDGSLLSGISFLSIASRFMSSTGLKILCQMGAKTDRIDDSGRSLIEAADAEAKRVRKLGIDPTEFMATVKQCMGAKGGSRTRKARRKNQQSSRRK